jgi:hypothetical protein
MAIDIVVIQSYLWVCTAEARAGLVFRGRGHLQTHSWILARLSVRY